MTSHADGQCDTVTLRIVDAEIKSVPLAQGYEEVFYPGEMEARNDLRNREQGIQLPGDTIADLRRIADETGFQALLPLD